jgi:hypothetical protein
MRRGSALDGATARDLAHRRRARALKYAVRVTRDAARREQ